MNRSLIASLLLLAVAAPALAGSARPDPAAQRVIDHWTPEARAAAIPRDFFIDAQGRGFVRGANGALVAHGHSGDQLTAKNPAPQPMAPPGGGSGDTTPPSITGMQPAGGTVGASVTFSAVITDASGIRSVSFVVVYPNGTQTQSFSPAYAGNNTWQTTVSGFTNGAWQWRVVAKDAAKSGNTATSANVPFTVDTGGGGGGGGGGGHITTNAAWTGGGAVQNAAGRIYFEMPSNKRRTRWAGYVCSGTVATDGASGRSTIVTAAHCVYDDANKAFARNVLFIPNQDGTSGSGTDLTCSNDPIGCWTPTFGVVDTNWTTRVFPDNVAWDYAFYVVSDSGAHSPGSTASSDELAVAAGSLGLNFGTVYTNDGDPSATSIDFTHALGYSYSDDPNFMYCAEDMTAESAVNWWLASCGLSGGASGGPWVQSASPGGGPVMSVNSWGYTNQPGMAGPKFSGTSTACVFGQAQALHFSSVQTTDGDEGAAISCP